jgi:hypothetical protein
VPTWKTKQKSYRRKRYLFLGSRQKDIPKLTDRGFHYLSVENYQFLKKQTKVSGSKNTSVIIDMSKLEFKGNNFKTIRHALNRAGKYNLVEEDNFRNIQDVKDLIEDWSNNMALKYFRDFSGKNYYFYANNFHEKCINVFLYDQNKLVAFATASPQVNESCTYIIGKALCHKYYGLSEYADVLLYKKCLENNISLIDLGQTTKGLIHYKTKFPSYTYNYYDGKII